MWLTSGRSTRPEATIHQPIAPCSAPSASSAAELPAIAARDRPLPREPGERQSEGEADQPAEQPVDIFPEEDGLEVGERHAAVDLLILRALPCKASNSACQAASPIGGIAPESGSQRTIDRPDSVSRVIPPTTTIRKTSAATTQQPAGDGARGAAARRGGAGDHGARYGGAAAAVANSQCELFSANVMLYLYRCDAYRRRGQGERQSDVLRGAIRNGSIDRLAIGLSGLCLVHCLASAVLLTLLASAGGLLLDPVIHEVGLTLAIAARRGRRSGAASASTAS